MVVYCSGCLLQWLFTAVVVYCNGCLLQWLNMRAAQMFATNLSPRAKVNINSAKSMGGDILHWDHVQISSWFTVCRVEQGR